MALRIEYIILISLTVVSIFIFIEKPVSIKVVESNSSEEVYFKNFMLLEVNEDGVANQLTASEGVKYRDSFKLSDINITYQKSHNLLAQKAIYVKDFIHLEGNIRLQRDDGFRFWSEDLNYKIKEKVAYTDKKFTINMGENMVSGKKLNYNLQSREVSGDNIDARVEYRESI